jgi:hypothetical protein
VFSSVLELEGDGGVPFAKVAPSIKNNQYSNLQLMLKELQT